MVEVDDWWQLFIVYLKEGKLPSNKSLASQIKKRILCYAYVNDTLYLISFQHMWVWCLGMDEVNKIMIEIYKEQCGAHQIKL